MLRRDCRSRTRNSNRIAHRRAEAGMRLSFDEETRLDILHPPRSLANTDSDTNNSSMVVRLRYGRFSLLLTGDIQREGERALLTSGQPLDSLVHCGDHR